MKSLILPIRLIIMCALLIGQPCWAFADAKSVKLGVLAFRSVPETLERWQPLADYLSQSLADRPVELIAADYADLEKIIVRNELDFVLTNPSHYIELRSRNFLSGALATMIVDEQGYAVTGFGGVIVTLAERDDIAALKNLAGKKIAAVSDSSLGGYRAQILSLHEQGVRLPRDVQLLFTGMPHDNAVQAVLTGEADAGFVRTGVIESMIHEGRLDASRIKVLGERSLPGFPFKLSTRLYPEWPFVALSQAETEIARKVAAALYLFTPDADIAARMGTIGFGIPADYEPVEHLARALRLPPYDSIPVFGITDVWHQYRWLIVAGTIALLIMGALVLLALLINRRLHIAKNLLDGERKRLAGIIEGTDVGTWEWNLQTGETIFNERWSEIVGYKQEEISPVSINTWMKFSHPDDLKKSEELLNRYFRGDLNYYECECRMRHKNGHWVWVLDRGKVISCSRDGKPLMMMGTHLDITERKTAALALEHKNAEMEEFVYIVSHDLKSPLLTIKSFLSELREDLQAGNQELINEDMNFLESATAKMNQLLEALLEYSRAGRSEQSAATRSLDHLIDSCLDALAGSLRKNQVDIKKDFLPFQLHGDQLRLGQIWQNLIENAVKYMGEQSHPRIEIGAEVKGGEVLFFVRDNGMGIATEHQQHIFGMFNQLQRGKEGIGLGLALVKKIVESYEGQIWVESAGVGQGSCFCFTLPEAISHEAETAMAF